MKASDSTDFKRLHPTLRSAAIELGEVVKSPNISLLDGYAVGIRMKEITEEFGTPIDSLERLAKVWKAKTSLLYACRVVAMCFTLEHIKQIQARISAGGSNFTIDDLSLISSIRDNDGRKAVFEGVLNGSPTADELKHNVAFHFLMRSFKNLTHSLSSGLSELELNRRMRRELRGRCDFRKVVRSPTNADLAPCFDFKLKQARISMATMVSSEDRTTEQVVDEACVHLERCRGYGPRTAICFIADNGTHNIAIRGGPFSKPFVEIDIASGDENCVELVKSYIWITPMVDPFALP